MKLYKVSKGTHAAVAKERGCWSTYTTKKENIFGVEDIVIDPAGIKPMVVADPVLEWWAKNDWAGFRSGEWVLMVKRSDVHLVA